MLRATCYGYYTTRKITRNTCKSLTGLLWFRDFCKFIPTRKFFPTYFNLLFAFSFADKKKIALVQIRVMYHRNLTSRRIDTLKLLRLSLVHLSMLFFCFTFLRWPFYSVSIWVPLSRSGARALARFRLLLLERPTNHRCDPFEFSSLKLLYTFSCSKVLDSADLSRFLGCLRSRCYDISTSFLPSVPLFRDSNYEDLYIYLFSWTLQNYSFWHV